MERGEGKTNSDRRGRRRKERKGEERSCIIKERLNKALSNQVTELPRKNLARPLCSRVPILCCRVPVARPR